MSEVPPSPFITVSSAVVWSCPWYRVRQDEIIMPDGQPGIYNTVEKEDAVWVVPVTGDGRIALIHQYRYTVDDWCWEIPAGSVKPGQTAGDAALDELLEEVGGTAAALDYIGRFYLANGICNEVGHIFIATGVSLGPVQHEPAEVMSRHLVPVAEVLEMARSGAISDGPTVLGLLLCEPRLIQMTAGSGDG